MSNIKINKLLKELLESEAVALATVMKQGTPNVIGVADVKVVDNNKIISFLLEQMLYLYFLMTVL